MATARDPNSKIATSRESAVLTNETPSRMTTGDTNDLRRLPIFSELSSLFLENVRLYYVFQQCNASNTFLVTTCDEVWAMKINEGDRRLRQGQCGNDGPCSVPVKVAALSGENVQSFAHGNQHVLALTGEGEIYAWGDNTFFQVGKAKYKKIRKPTLVYDGRDPAIEIACGEYHSVCRTKKGDVYCWGWGLHGQIGTGNKMNQPTPRKVLGLIADLKCTGISCHAYATVAVFENGEVYVWGDNHGGRLGIGSQNNAWIPVKVDVESVTIKKVATGSFHTLALSDNGSLYVWGHNNGGQLGFPSEDPQRKPVCHSGLRESHGRIIDIAACQNTSAAMTDGCKVLVWGVTKEGVLRSPTEVSCESLQDAFAKMAPSFVTPVPVVTIPTSVINTARTLVSQDSSPLTDWGRNLLNTHIEHFDNPSFSDVKFLLQKKIIHAHKVLLNLQSEYFRKMFQGPWRNIEGDTIEVTETSYPVYRAFIRYFYTGDVDLEVSDALELLQWASLCSEHALARICQRRIEDMISVENCASVYLHSVRSGHTELEDSCMRFAANHLTAVTGTSAFSALPLDILPRFFSKVAERGAFKS